MSSTAQSAAEIKTFKELVEEFKATLKDSGVDTPDLDARLLVQGMFEISHEELLLKYNDEVSKLEEASLRRALARRLDHEPVSRIMGMRSFWNDDFKVTPETLDPRADSETLIEAVLAWVPEGKKKKQRIFDLGTGTGCLLLSLLGEWPTSVGIGVDISKGALRCAAANSRRLKLQKRSGFVHSDWNSFRPNTLADIVISNPPYIPERDRLTLSLEVLNYDPPEALFAGHDGLEAYRTLADNMAYFLKPTGLAFYEIGHDQAKDVKDILCAHGQTVLETRQDLAGHDRVVVARLTG
jgi:release factor glutamine methyltransferase